MTKKASLTFEEAKALADECKDYTEFRTKYPYVNRLVRENDWSDELFPQRKKHHYWTLEKIQKVASRFENFSAFNKEHPSLYSKALKNGWIDHLFPVRRRVRTDEEILEIMSKYRYQKDFRVGDKGAYLAAYRRGLIKSDSFEEVPRPIKWTYAKVEAIAKTYTEHSLFHKEHEYLYRLCRKNGWLEDFFPDRRKVRTDEELIIEAKRFTQLKEFREEEPNLYNSIIRRGILLRATEHMHRLHDWHKTEEGALSIVSKYSKLKDFTSNHKDWYLWILKQENSDEILKDLERSNPEPYTLERVKKIASVFDSPGPFSDFASGAWAWAKRSDHWDEITAHMERVVREPFTREEVEKIASNFSTPTDFQQANGAAYNHAQRNGYLYEITRNMDGTSGFDLNKPTIVYYLRILSNFGFLYKVGITQLSVAKRFSAKERLLITVLEEFNFPTGLEAKIEEQRILEEHKVHKYHGEPILDSGNTELFTKDVLGLDPEFN